MSAFQNFYEAINPDFLTLSLLSIHSQLLCIAGE